MTTRTYPLPCLSAYCGKAECPESCPNLPKLEEFKAWREATNAYRPDPIWCPAIWKEDV